MANAIPPPNNNKIPHGSLTASSQASNFLSPFLFGIMNKVTAAIMAIIVSSISGMYFLITKDCVIHAKAVAIKIIITDFSS